MAYGLATEANTLLRVEDRALPDEGLDATGTTVDLVEGDLANDLVAVLPVTYGQCWAAVVEGSIYAYLRSFLIFSISPGSLLANVSFSDCMHC